LAKLFFHQDLLFADGKFFKKLRIFEHPVKTVHDLGKLDSMP